VVGFAAGRLLRAGASQAHANGPPASIPPSGAGPSAPSVGGPMSTPSVAAYEQPGLPGAHAPTPPVGPAPVPPVPPVPPAPPLASRPGPGVAR
jgi:hypothetical protein